MLAYVWRPDTEAWREWAIGKLGEAGWSKEFAHHTVWGLQCLKEASHLVTDFLRVPPHLRGLRVSVPGYGLTSVFGDKNSHRDTFFDSHRTPSF